MQLPDSTLNDQGHRVAALVNQFLQNYRLILPSPRVCGVQENGEQAVPRTAVAAQNHLICAQPCTLIDPHVSHLSSHQFKDALTPFQPPINCTNYHASTSGPFLGAFTGRSAQRGFRIVVICRCLPGIKWIATLLNVTYGNMASLPANTLNHFRDYCRMRFTTPLTIRKSGTFPSFVNGPLQSTATAIKLLRPTSTSFVFDLLDWCKTHATTFLPLIEDCPSLLFVK
jgi:hypothetical protein